MGAWGRAAVVLGLVVSCSGGGGAPEEPARPSPEPQMQGAECTAGGRDVLTARCGGCHGAAAQPNVSFPTDEAAQQWSDRIRDRALISRTMPPGAPLEACEADALEAYLDGLGPWDAGRPLPACTPDCSGKQCGDDGCGGACGSCGAREVCTAGQCLCTPQCGGRACGDDGCGGACGTCGAGTVCDTAQGACVTTCTPSCDGRACGDDGCGGACGSCAAGTSCDAAGQCVAPPPTYAAAVHPIFQARGCASGGCHAGASPSSGLDLSSAAAARAELVNTASSCGRTLVVPGSAATSYLMNKLTGAGMCGGARMPLGRGALPAAELDAIRGWIDSGAH